LTYDPVEDVFYIGGWVDYKMYKIAGQSWAEPGKILRVYDDVTLAIAGIARVGWHLVLTLNTHPDLIAVMDSITGEIITWMESPSVSSIRVGGCETGRERQRVDGIPGSTRSTRHGISTRHGALPWMIRRSG